MRLWSFISGAWQFNDYTYTASTGGGQQSAALTTPTPGSTLTSDTATFGWTAGSGVTQYWLSIGLTTGAGDVYSASAGTALSATVDNLPTDGRTLNVRLWSLIAGTWQFRDYTYIAGPKGAITAPVPQATLQSGSATFAWRSGGTVGQYWLSVGTTAGGSDLYNQSIGTGLTATVNGLPTDGSTVYVRLWSLIGGTWLFNDYTYTSVGGGSRPAMTAPVPGATLAGVSDTLSWSAGTGVTEYWLYVGTGPGGTDLFNASTGTSRTRILNNLPTDGSTVYVRLWSSVAGDWRFNDYTYRAH